MLYLKIIHGLIPTVQSVLILDVKKLQNNSLLIKGVKMLNNN